MLIEARGVTPQTSRRLEEQSRQLRDGARVYMERHPRELEPLLVLACPGVLRQSKRAAAAQQNLEIWDGPYLSARAGQLDITVQAGIAPGGEHGVVPGYDLASRLEAIRPGTAGWPAYEKYCEDLLSFLFVPPPNPPIPQSRDERHVNRRDYVLPNYATDSSFWQFMRTHYEAHLVVAEVKNLSRGPRPSTACPPARSSARCSSQSAPKTSWITGGGPLAAARSRPHTCLTSGTRCGSSSSELALLPDLDQAITTLQQAADVASAAPSIRVRASRAAGKLAAGSEPGKAARLFERAVQLLPEIAPRHLERSDQQHALGGFAGLATDAAALALQDPTTPDGERAGRALQLLEAGRAVLLSQALEIRSDLTDLTERHPDLAARFSQLRDLLDQASDVSASIPAHAHTGPGRTARDRQRLADEFTKVLAQIRSLDHFTSFAQPPSTEDLLAQATHGPVVDLAGESPIDRSCDGSSRPDSARSMAGQFRAGRAELAGHDRDWLTG